MARPLTHHLGKNYPQPTLGSIDHLPGPRTRIEHFGTVLAPLHYEPEYAYPLVIWLDQATEMDGPRLRRPKESRLIAQRLENRPELEDAGHSPIQRSPEAMPLSTAMNCISLRNFAAISARSFETASSNTNVLDRLIEAARSKLNIHPERVFLVVRGPDWTPVQQLLVGNCSKLAGVAWIARRSDSIRQQIVAAGLQASSLANQSATQLLIAAEDLPDSIDLAMQKARHLHAIGWEPTIVTSKAGNSFDRSALANANRWMMGIVTGQAAFPTLPPQSSVPAILEN